MTERERLTYAPLPDPLVRLEDSDGEAIYVAPSQVVVIANAIPWGDEEERGVRCTELVLRSGGTPVRVRGLPDAVAARLGVIR